jgi:hypothetical protein
MSNEYSLPIITGGCDTVDNNSLEEAEKLYEAYPRKKARPVAIRSILSALKKATFQELMAGVQRYGKETEGTAPKYIAHPATWFNQERWKDAKDSRSSGGYFSV